MALQDDVLTLPLKVAQDLLAQPLRTKASLTSFDDETDKAEFESNMPEFFRQAAQQIGQAEQVRAAQQSEFAQRAQAFEEENADTYVGPVQRAAAQREEYARGQAQAQEEAARLPQPVRDAPNIPGSGLLSKAIGFGKKALDVTGAIPDALGDVAGAVTPDVVESRIPQQVQSVLKNAPGQAVGTAVGGPFGFLAATALQNPDKALSIVKKVMKVDHNIGLQAAQAVFPKTDWDWNLPGLHNVNVEGIMAEVMRPSNFIPVGGPGKEIAGKFAWKVVAKWLATEGLMNASISGADTLSLTDDPNAILMSMAIGFVGGAALPGSVFMGGRYFNNLKVKGLDGPALVEQVIEDAAKAKLDPEGFVTENADALGIQVREEASVQVPEARIDERPQTSDDAKLDRHTLLTPEGDKIEYRGSHIADVTAVMERKGRRTALLNKAIENIRARDPHAIVTAELNSESGARLFAKQEGVSFTSREGAALTPEEAIAAATRGEGPSAEIRPIPASVKAEVPKDARWNEETFDGVQRRLIRKTGHGQLWENPDGSFEIIDPRWMDMTTGPTKGAGGTPLQHFDDIDAASAKLDAMTTRGELPVEEREYQFREAAKKDVAKATDVRETVRQAEEIVEEARKPVGAVEEAEQAAANARPVATPREEVKQPRAQREATEAARTEETYRPIVDDTIGEQGGATYNPRTGKPVEYKDYFVGGFAPSKRVKASEFTPADVAAYVKQHFDGAFKEPGVHVGTERVVTDGVEWVNIDAVRRVASRDQALRLGKLNGEQRIWDANTSKAIEVPGVKQTDISVNVTERTPVVRFLDGETGHLDLSRIGTVASEWVKAAGDSIKRVLVYVRELGRKFHTNELGALMAGRKTVEGMSATDVLDFGASRRWLVPGESWAQWNASMDAKLGGGAEFWASRQGTIREHAAKMMGLTGEGPQGVTGKGVRFGKESGPSTLERLIELAEAGKSIKTLTGAHINMTKWYNGFWKTMQEHFGDDAEVMTRIMAATQSNNSPANGVGLAMRAYLQWKMGDPISAMGSSVVRNAIEAILMGKVPAGPKITPFWEALRFRGARGSNAVAVDRWVIAALGATSQGPGMDVKALQGNKAFIRFAQALIKSAADEAGISPRGFQAAIWGGFRKEFDGMLKAAGGKPMGGDNDFFENLLLRRFAEHDLRSPVDFRLNTVKNAQAKLVNDDPRTAELEYWHLLRSKEVAKFTGTTPAKASELMREAMLSEWNLKVAAVRLLDTGEVPTHLRTPEVIDEVKRTAAFAKRAFRDRVAMADAKTLKDLKDIPDWQKRVVDAEVAERARTGEVISGATGTPLPADETKRLTMLGWMRVPDNPKSVMRTQRLLDELDDVKTEQDLIRWMKRRGVREIVGDKQAFIGKMTETGETYELAGKVTNKTEASPYWEPRSFYENRLVLNVPRVKAELRKRFPIESSQTRPIADTLKIREVGERLGACALELVD